MALVRLEGVILKSLPLGDTSRIAVLYTRELGLLRAVAKGARQPRSRFAGALEPFGRIEGLLYTKEGRELHLLSSADLLESLARVDSGLERLVHAQAAVEIVDRLVWGEEPHAELYDLLLAVLRRIAEATEDRLAAVTLAFQLQAAGLLGYRPVLDRCASCGRRQRAWRHFGPREGGVLCTRCAGTETTAAPISGGAAADLAALEAADLERGPPDPPARPGELSILVEVFLQSHFQRFSGLRSMELLRDLEGSRGGNGR